MRRYEVWVVNPGKFKLSDLHKVRWCVAHCTSWEAKAAACRLLFGDSLVRPLNVRVYEFNSGQVEDFTP